MVIVQTLERLLEDIDNQVMEEKEVFGD